jgi:diaminopimelate epimerase
MNGAGNKILVLDLRGSGLAVSPAEARAIGAGEGLGYDQLMALHDADAPGVDAAMKIFNIDGSLSSACGNGTRCVAWALSRDGRDRVTLDSDAGRLEVTRAGEWAFTADMGAPRFDWREIPLARAQADMDAVDIAYPGHAEIGRPSALSMGNPHAIWFVDNVEGYDLATNGPLLERDPLFPERANISLAHVVAPDRIRLKVWERGAGLTLACGTAACATLVAAARRGLTARRATLMLPGGDLVIEWRARDDHMLMTGPVEFEAEIPLRPTLFEGLPA